MRNQRIPGGRLMEYVQQLESQGIARNRIMYRSSGRSMDFDVEVKIASSDLYVKNTLAMQDRGANSPTHWRAVR